MPLHPGVRTALTLGVLGIVVLLALTWGVSRLTAPLPEFGAEALPTCTEREVAAGAEVRPADVVVSVYNAGTRQGLATRTLNELTNRGYAPGKTGNAPGTVRVRTTQVWSADPDGPAARLVAAQFGAQTQVVEPAIPSYADDGVVVIVGNRSRLATGPPTIRTEAPATVCGPVAG